MPFGNVEMFAQGLNVGYEVPRRVVGSVGIGAGLSTSALIEQYHVIFRRVEEDGVAFGAIAAWSPVEINYCRRLAWDKEA